jgi:small subunit ribosomal protein S3
MGQKVNPIGMRLALNKNWKSKWYVDIKNYPKVLLSDIKTREYIMKELAAGGISAVIIERCARDVATIIIEAARPGVLMGKNGKDVEKQRQKISAMMGVPINLKIEEVKRPDLNARLVAEGVASQLARRIMFRRAMKRAVSNAMRQGAKGIKIAVAGRLGGSEIARTEWYREGRVPLHTLRADIDYALAEAKTTYGKIGVKVWIFKGDAVRNRSEAKSAGESLKD